MNIYSAGYRGFQLGTEVSGYRGFQLGIQRLPATEVSGYRFRETGNLL
jgi:hypothetical protein